MLSETLQTINETMSRYDIYLKVLYSCGVFVSGYVIKNLRTFFRKRKLKRTLGLNEKKKDVVLYIPIRKFRYWADREDVLVLYEEMLIATEVRKCISDLSDEYVFSIGTGSSYSASTNTFFFGGFGAHEYVKSLFLEYAARNLIFFSTRESTYQTLPDSDRKLYEIVGDHAKPYRYIYIRNGTEQKLSAKPAWEEALCEARTERFSRFQFDDAKEDVFFIMRMKNSGKQLMEEKGTVNIYFGMQSAYVTYELSRALNQYRNALYGLTKRHKGSYVLMGKYKIFSQDAANRVTAGELDFSSVIDLTPVFFPE